MLHMFYRYAVIVLNEPVFSNIYIGFLFQSILILSEVLITSYFAKAGESILNVSPFLAYFSYK